MRNFYYGLSGLAAVFLMLGSSAVVARAQTDANASSSKVGQTLVKPLEASVAASPAPESDLECAGFIQYAPAPNYLQIVGGEQEQEQRIYSQGNFVYINAGAQQGVRVGQEYSVVRPRGRFSTKLTNKSGTLGVFTQELGRLRVTEVKDRVSVAQVTHSCDNLLLGDLLRAATQRTAPSAQARGAFNRFADPSGKQRGRIVLARDSREMLSRNQIMYVDLGTEDKVQVGDKLTVYRPVGTGNVTRFRDEEVTPSASYGFESERFRGGKFSNKAQRVQDPNSNGVYGPMITTPKIKRSRPPLPRKIVGEAVILGVQQRTATVVITRVAQEIHTGDYVEVQ